MLIIGAPLHNKCRGAARGGSERESGSLCAGLDAASTVRYRARHRRRRAALSSWRFSRLLPARRAPFAAQLACARKLQVATTGTVCNSDTCRGAPCACARPCYHCFISRLHLSSAASAIIVCLCVSRPSCCLCAIRLLTTNRVRVPPCLSVCVVVGASQCVCVCVVTIM